MEKIDLVWMFSGNTPVGTVKKNIDVIESLDFIDNVYVLKSRYNEYKEIFIDKSKFDIYDENDFYDFLKTTAKTVLRLSTYRVILYDNLVKKIYAQHLKNNNLYTYSDANDLMLELVFELVSNKVFDHVGIDYKLYFPDNTLNLFKEVKSGTYIFDQDDQQYYYKNHFDDYYKYPKGLNLEPTMNCNLKCSMCNYWSDSYDNSWKKNKPNNIDFSLYKRLIDELSTYPIPPNIELCYRGEPLLNKKIVDIVQYATDNNVPTTIVTNATLLTQELTGNLLKAGLNGIYFSVDGATEETYMKVRQGSDFKRVIENIEYFLDKNKQTRNIYTWIKTVDMDINKHEQMDIVNQWLEKGIDGVIIQNLSIRGNDEYALWFNPQSIENLKNNRYPCHLLWNNMTIATSGNVSNCVTFFEENDEDLLGNLNKKTLLEIWNNEEITARRKAALDGRYDEIPLCKDCDGVSCSALSIYKDIIDDNIYVNYLAGVRTYTKTTNKKLYPEYKC